LLAWLALYLFSEIVEHPPKITIHNLHQPSPNALSSFGGQRQPLMEINRCADHLAIHKTCGVEGDIVNPTFYVKSVG